MSTDPCKISLSTAINAVIFERKLYAKLNPTFFIPQFPLVAAAAEMQYIKKHIMDDKAFRLLAANIVCIIAAYVGVAMRLVSRYYQHIGIKADDWWIVASLVNHTFLGKISGI